MNEQAIRIVIDAVFETASKSLTGHPLAALVLSGVRDVVDGRLEEIITVVQKQLGQ